MPCLRLLLSNDDDELSSSCPPFSQSTNAVLPCSLLVHIRLLNSECLIGIVTSGCEPSAESKKVVPVFSNPIIAKSSTPSVVLLVFPLLVECDDDVVVNGSDDDAPSFVTAERVVSRSTSKRPTDPIANISDAI